MNRTAFAVAVIAGIGALTAAAVPSAARAQGMPAAAQPFHVGVAAGATIPLSDALNVPETGGGIGSKTGFHVTGLAEYQPAAFPFGIRGEFMYHDLKGETFSVSDPTFGSLSLRPDVRYLAGTLNAILSGGGVSARPYAIVGIGVYNTRTKAVVSATFDGSSVSGSQTESGTNFGLNGGIGARFPLSGLQTFVEARYHYIFNKETECDVSTGEEVCVTRDNSSIIPISFGIVF